MAEAEGKGKVESRKLKFLTEGNEVNEETRLQKIWSEPPPGMTIVKSGIVQEGDYFYIAKLGAWAPVPRIGIGEQIGSAIIARGKIDFAQVKKLENDAG